MAWYEPGIRPIPVQIARNFAFYGLLMSALLILFNPNGDARFPDGEGWKRLAMIGLPFILAASVLEPFAERASARM